MVEKKCFKCGETKPLSAFYTHPRTADGHLNKCKECCKAYARAHDTTEYDTKRYRNNPKRYLQHKYYGMLTRCVRGIGHKSYVGRDVLSKKEWEGWCKLTMPTFMSLYKNWQTSGYKRGLSPSVDRINNADGYVLGNLQWITQSANSRKHTKQDPILT